MNWATWCFAVVILVSSTGWLFLIARFWILRKEFEIAARSPILLDISAIGTLAMVTSVLLHWLLQTVGKRLPCAAIFWVSHSVYAVSTFPYCIRAVRLVVVYNRYVVAVVVPCVLQGISGQVRAMSVALAVRTSLFYSKKPCYYASGGHACFYWNDVLLSASVMVVVGAPFLLLGLQLLKVDDAFKLGEEIVRVIGGCCLCQVSVTVLQILVMFKVLPDSRQVHLVGEILAFLFAINGIYWGRFVPMVRVHRKNHWSWFASAVCPIENDAEIGATPGTDDVLTLARKGGAMSHRFAQFVRENLCMESWDFVVDAVRYEQESTAVDDQFKTYLHISSQYLLPTSPDEINISSAMSKHMAAFRTREAFGALNEDERRTILDEPVMEIVRVLEQNLLNNFRRLVALQDGRPRAALSKAAKGDADLMTLMKFSSRDKSDRPV
ncbi:unnamed protein product [Scytosiphon promiscuus]